MRRGGPLLARRPVYKNIIESSYLVSKGTSKQNDLNFQETETKKKIIQTTIRNERKPKILLVTIAT